MSCLSTISKRRSVSFMLTEELEAILNERNLQVDQWNSTSWALLTAAAVGYSTSKDEVVKLSDRRLAFRVLLAGLHAHYKDDWRSDLLPGDTELARHHKVAAKVLKKYLDGGTPTVEDVFAWRTELGI